jgi:methyl-accepting chemotaxis protein
MVNQGSAQLHQLIQAIETIQTSNHEISHQFDLTNQNIEQILHMIAEIGSKTKVINDIVFQTKLLSFNASVEAARAGEYGKGFSVVAEEVGKLAAMSGEASKEISNLLNQSVGTVSSIREETKANVAVILDTAGQRLNQGTSVAESCKQVFASITDLVGQVRSNVEQISMAATEQTSGVKEIRRAMSALNNVVQGNGTVSSKVLGSAQAVSAESDQLSRSVDEMVALIGGRAKKVRDAA